MLAKHLYASPPPGVPAGSGGALLLCYGGDAVELVLAYLLCRRWLAPATSSRIPVVRRSPVAR